MVWILLFFFELSKIAIIFIVVPIYKHGWKNMRISTSSLRGFERKIDGITQREAAEINADMLWNETENIKPQTILGQKFGLSVTSNGVEIS